MLGALVLVILVVAAWNANRRKNLKGDDLEESRRRSQWFALAVMLTVTVLGLIRVVAGGKF
jgi:cytochrome oxidase assembly protein ShyY1